MVADRANLTGMTTTATATELRNAALNGKHATPLPTGTPERRESAGISRILEGNVTTEEGGQIS